MLISILQKGPYAKTLARCLQLDPERVHRSEFAFGNALVFFPRLEEDQTEVTMLMEVAEDRLPREGVFTGEGHALRQYVHARAYSASACMALALAKAFEKAIAAADSTTRQLEVSITAVDTKLDTTTLHTWFRPLGWQLTVTPSSVAQTDESPTCIDIKLRGKMTVAAALLQLQVLLCAMDADHIYWIGEAATRSYVEMASTHFKAHPHLEGIQHALSRYPDHRNRIALGNLMEEDDVSEQRSTVHLPTEAELDSLHKQVSKLWHDQPFSKILLLMAEKGRWGTAFAQIDAVESVTLTHPDVAVLQSAIKTLNTDNTLTINQKQKLKLIPNAPLFKNPLLQGPDLAVVADMLALLPKWHRPALESMIFGYLGAKRIVWIEAEALGFENWASMVANTYPYDVQLLSPGPELPQMQIACFDLQPNR